MLALLVPALINYLMDSDFTKYNANISKSRVKLHEFSLQYLLKVGPVYPQVCLILRFIIINQYQNIIIFNVIFQEFKIIMSQNNKLRTKLEHTIKTNKSSQQQFDAGCQVSQNVTKSTQPSIKLKTDFTNFNQHKES